MRSIKKHRLTGINIPDATPVVNKRYFLGIDPEIANGFLEYIKSPYGSDYPSSLTFSSTQLKYVFLTLCNSKGEVIHENIPAYSLIATLNNGRWFKVMAQVDLSQSYFVFSEGHGISSSLTIPLELQFVPKSQL